MTQPAPPGFRDLVQAVEHLSSAWSCIEEYLQGAPATPMPLEHVPGTLRLLAHLLDDELDALSP